MSLYLKYRPQDFDNLIGQDAIKTTLLNSLKTGNISHAYLFNGPRGTGKTTCARLIAKALNCQKLNDDGTPCNSCDNCEAINIGGFVDLIEIDAASNTGIDNIRELQSKIGFSPTLGKKKVYVLDEVHMLSKGAFNALLKTLEEPPEFVHFILVTTERHKVPETIISRCIVFNFNNITQDDIISRLEHICNEEKLACEEKALQLIAHEAKGGLRDAISTLDKLRSQGDIVYGQVADNLGITSNIIVNEFIRVLMDGDGKSALGIINELVSKSYDIPTFNRELIEELREKMLASVSDQDELKKIMEIIEIFTQASNDFAISVIPQLPLEMAVFKSISVLGGQSNSSKNEGILDKLFHSSKKEEVPVAPKKEEKVEIKEIHKEEKKAVSEYPELNLDNAKDKKPELENLLKDAAHKIAFRNLKIVGFNDLTLALETINDHDAKMLSSQKGMDDLVNSFKSVFGTGELKFKINAKQEEEIKSVVDKEEEKKGENLNQVAESLFDF